jgi:soluble lytic murein transglycosylase-like protein
MAFLDKLEHMYYYSLYPGICQSVFFEFDCWETIMRHGPGLVIIGSILGCFLLTIFLYHVSEGASLPQAAADLAALSVKDANSVKQADGSQNGVVEKGADGKRANTTDQSTDCIVSVRYPQSIRQWCGVITDQAKKRNLDPDLVAALIWQESGGNASAYSQSGAVGLMQVMPKDGLAAGFQCGSGPCFSQRPSIQQLQEPQFNVSYGTQMLSGLVSKNGSLRDGLRSYGPYDVGYTYADKVLGIYESYRKK